MAAIPSPLYDYYCDGTASAYLIQHTSTTATISNFPDRIWRQNKQKWFYHQGKCFKTKKQAVAYKNLLRSQERAHQLSFIKKKILHRTVRVVKKPHNAPSVKQFYYAKRKKFKEKLGMKH